MLYCNCNEEESVRPTRLYVDINAIKHNLDSFYHALGDGIDIMPMVKANAYGCGADIVSGIFEKSAYVAVADTKEGEALRRVYQNYSIVLIYQPALSEINAIIELSFIPSVCDYDFAFELDKRAKESGVTVRIHVKIDTGAGRLGIAPDQCRQFAESMLRLKNIKVDGLFTHYACADSFDSDDVDFTNRQTALFIEGVEEFESVYGAVKYKHACSGAAIFTQSKARFNMVRPGYMLYGYYPVPKMREYISLKPALKLVSTVLCVKKVSKGTPISYNRTYITERESIIAIVAAGYSDGLFRAMSNKGSFVIHGQKAPIVGTICMDLTMIDVTDIACEVKAGDDAVIFDNVNVTIEDMAEICGTIGYEIITRIAESTQRIAVK